jgi:type IV pilus assembly protein PilW
MSHSIGRLTQGGFSLVELMIAMTLGLVLVAGVAALSQNSNQIYRSLNGTSQQTENGRYALEILTDDLQHAGFFGVFAPPVALPAALPSPCSEDPVTIAADLRDGLLLPVTGLNNPMVVHSSFSGCISNNDDLLGGTDVLAIRRADTGIVDIGVNNIVDATDLTNGNAYIQTSLDRYAIGVCNSDNNPPCTGLRKDDAGDTPIPQALAKDLFSVPKRDGVTPADIRRYHVHVYFIRPWSTKEGDGIPTLVRSVLTNSGNVPTMTAEALIDGVENMQIQYGLDNGAAGATANDGSPDQYVDEPASLSDWGSVVAVRMNLLVRTLEPDPAYTDSRKTYTLGEGNVIDPPNDHFRRHVFSSVVKLENIGTRRECKQPVPLPPYCR